MLSTGNFLYDLDKPLARLGRVVKSPLPAGHVPRESYQKITVDMQTKNRHSCPLYLSLLLRSGRMFKNPQHLRAQRDLSRGVASGTPARDEKSGWGNVGPSRGRLRAPRSPKKSGTKDRGASRRACRGAPLRSAEDFTKAENLVP